MDRVLVERAISGDREAYTELVKQSIDRSYAFAGLILRDPDWARDATQEAYVKAWRDLSSLRDPARFDAWLRRLVLRACYQELGRERRHRHVGIAEIDVGGTMRTAVRRLDDPFRDARPARARLQAPDAGPARRARPPALPRPDDRGGAEAMGVPIGTAKSRLHRATSAMRAVLEADARTPLAIEGPVS